MVGDLQGRYLDGTARPMRVPRRGQHPATAKVLAERRLLLSSVTREPRAAGRPDPRAARRRGPVR